MLPLQTINYQSVDLSWCQKEFGPRARFIRPVFGFFRISVFVDELIMQGRVKVHLEQLEMFVQFTIRVVERYYQDSYVCRVNF